MNCSALAPTRKRTPKNQSSKVTKWTEEEDQRLIKLVNEAKTSNWVELAQKFENKTAQQLSERYEKVLNPSLIKGSWTREEDQTIIEFVRTHGTKSWAKLSLILPGRIGKQCRERWKNHLDPDVNRDPWTPEEDQTLIQLHSQIGNQWVKIAEHLPGRSDNSIKNRWNSTLKKKIEADLLGVPRPKRGRPSLKNRPLSADDIPKPPRLEEVISVPEPKSNGSLKLATPGFSLFSPLTAHSPSEIASPSIGFSPYSSYNTLVSPNSNQTFDSLTQNQLFSPMISTPKLESISLSTPKLESISLLSPILKPQF